MATLSLLIVPFLFLFTFAYLFSEITLEEIMADFSISIFRLITAYLIAVLLAWSLALAFSFGKRAHIALPAFDVLQSFPTFAIVPLAILAFGASSVTVIFFLVITIVWPILFSTVNALRLVKTELREAADIYGLKGLARLRYFSVPASIPGVVTGSMIGIGEGWEALIATEIIMQTGLGLGTFFEVHSGNYAITALGIIGLMLIIFSLNRLVWTPILNRVYQRMEE